MMITQFEQQEIIEDARRRVSKYLLEVIMQDEKYRGLWNEVFAGFIAKQNRYTIGLTGVRRSVNKEQLEHNLQDVFEFLIRSAAEEEVQSYSTGQVAEFFGVSIQTIHNWIESGRLSGFQKPEPFKQTKIPDTAVWTAATGEKLTLQNVISMYEQEKASRPAYPETKTEEIKAIEDEIAFFTKKYQNSFDETLGRKIEQNVPLSEEEQRDADEWSYWLERLGRVK